MLYNDFVHEIKHQVAESVLQIRTTLTIQVNADCLTKLMPKSRILSKFCKPIMVNLNNSIQLLPDNSQATSHLRDMRAACREYLDNSNNRYAPPFRFLAHLGRLRTIFGYHIAKLAVME